MDAMEVATEYATMAAVIGVIVPAIYWLRNVIMSWGASRD